MAPAGFPHFSQGFPISPSPQALTYIPCQLAEQGFEVVIDLLLREYFLYTKKPERIG